MRAVLRNFDWATARDVVAIATMILAGYAGIAWLVHMSIREAEVVSPFLLIFGHLCSVLVVLVSAIHSGLLLLTSNRLRAMEDTLRDRLNKSVFDVSIDRNTAPDSGIRREADRE